MPLSGPSVLALHHVSHEPLGSDEIQNINASRLTSGLLADARLSVNVLKFTGGYPGGNTRFLREDGTFVATSVSGGTPAPHHATHEQGGIDEIVNAAWINKTNFFNATQVITLPGNSPSGSSLRILSNSGEGALVELRDLTTLADRQTGYLRYRGGNISFEAIGPLGQLVEGWTYGQNKLLVRGQDPYPVSLIFNRLTYSASSPQLINWPGRDDLELMRTDTSSRSVFLAAGFGDTPLDASQLLSGALPDARLSINVLKYQGGYPGGTINFLRADGTFSEPPVNTGPMGPQGPAGASSSIFNYRSDTQSQAANDPGTGKLKWNNVNQQLATEIYFDWITADSIDITNIVRTTEADDKFIIQDSDFAANYKVWKLLEPVTIMADWFLAKVQFIEAGGAGSFGNNQRISVLVKSKGATGPIGPQGPAGADGKSADLNYTGDYNSATVYKDGDIVVASDGVAYLCVVEGTNTPPEAWPGVSNGVIAAHASTHALTGTDAITLDTTQVTGLPAKLTSHDNSISTLNTNVANNTTSINTINANAAFKNQANVFSLAQTINGELDLTGGTGTVYNTAPLEIRTTLTPRVSFHWPGVVASQIGMDSAGIIRTYDNPGTGYERFAASSITAYGNILVNKAQPELQLWAPGNTTRARFLNSSTDSRLNITANAYRNPDLTFAKDDASKSSGILTMFEDGQFSIYTMPANSTTPVNTFQVLANGNGSLTGTFFPNAISAASSITSGYGYGCKPGTAGAVGGNVFNFNWVGTVDSWIDNVRIGAIAMASDARLKRDFTPLKHSLDKILKMRPGTFYFKKFDKDIDPNPDLHLGLLAQEVAKIAPEVTSKIDMKTDLTPDGMYQVNYTEIIPMLIAAIQELNHKIKN